MNQIETLCMELDTRLVALTEAERRYEGRTSLAYLSPEDARSIRNRLNPLSVNYSRVVTEAFASRLNIEGLTRNGTNLDELWQLWRSVGMDSLSHCAILEALVAGSAFITVWANGTQPIVSVDSARDVLVKVDPVSRETQLAFKRIVRAGKGFAVLFEPHKVTRFEGAEAPAGIVPNTGWKVVETFANPLGVVPVIPVVNSQRLGDEYGTPEARPIWALNDALEKLGTDLLTASEFTARQQRWASGLALEVEEDAEGNEIEVRPFRNAPGEVWVSEDPQTKFGAFPSADLGSYENAIELVIRQIGAISGLPAHFLGLSNVTDPHSGEQLRAASQSLLQKVEAKQALFGVAFARVAALLEAITSGGKVNNTILVDWTSPELISSAALADGVTKLHQAGILPLEATWQRLGYSPDEISAMRTQLLQERFERGTR